MLVAVGIACEIVETETEVKLLVRDELFEKARFELWQYEQENNKPRPRGKNLVPVYQNAIPGVAAYVVVICLVGWLASEGTFNRDWFAAGRVDGELIREGEWWRTITALTLHSGIRHLVGNIVFGVLFGLMAGRLLGSGVAWLGVVVASATANLCNTLLLLSTHRSIGASTAVFAALGIVAGYVWRGRLMAQDRWPLRLGPIVGGIALLAYTGTGDENTDIGAHLAGFAGGFLAGMLLTLAQRYLPRRTLQIGSGLAAALLVAAAWVMAL